MTMNKAEVKEILDTIQDAYQNFEITKSRAKLWLDLLSDIHFQAARSNLIHHIQSSKFAPTIADLRENYTPPKKPTDNEKRMLDLEKEVYGHVLD